MATSGSTDINLTRNELLLGALRLIGKSGRGKTAGADDIADAAEALELMVKTLQATGTHLWKLKEATLFVEKGTSEYSLTGANCTLSYIATTMKVAGVATDTTIDVNSIAGLTSGDNIGIELDDGTMQWTTISGTSIGDTVPLTTALTGAAAISNTVYAYTTKLIRPLKAVSARRQGTNDVDIDVISRDEYYRLPTKDASGQVNQIYYDPQLSVGKLHIWPTGDQADDRVQITFMMPLEDFDSADINPDFPQEWLEALKWALAARLGPEYGIPLDKQAYLDQMSAGKLEFISGFDEEYTSVYFEVES